MKKFKRFRTTDKRTAAVLFAFLGVRRGTGSGKYVSLTEVTNVVLGKRFVNSDGPLRAQGLRVVKASLKRLQKVLHLGEGVSVYPTSEELYIAGVAPTYETAATAYSGKISSLDWYYIQDTSATNELGRAYLEFVNKIAGSITISVQKQLSDLTSAESYAQQ